MTWQHDPNLLEIVAFDAPPCWLGERVAGPPEPPWHQPSWTGGVQCPHGHTTVQDSGMWRVAPDPDDPDDDMAPLWHRAICECGWCGPERRETASSIIDMADHSWPQWRAQPLECSDKLHPKGKKGQPPPARKLSPVAVVEPCGPAAHRGMSIGRYRVGNLCNGAFISQGLAHICSHPAHWDRHANAAFWRDHFAILSAVQWALDTHAYQVNLPITTELARRGVTAGQVTCHAHNHFHCAWVACPCPCHTEDMDRFVDEAEAVAGDKAMARRWSDPDRRKPPTPPAPPPGPKVTSRGQYAMF